MCIHSHVFHDIHSHAGALQAWSQHYDQLSAGSYRGYLEDLHVPGMRIFRERMSCRVAQHTVPPLGTVSLLVPLQSMCQHSSESRTDEHILPDGVTLLPGEKELFFCTPPDTDYVVVSLECGFLAQLLVPEDLACFLSKPHRYHLNVPGASLRALQSYCLQVLVWAGADTRLAKQVGWQKSVRDEMTCRILEYLEAGEGSRARLRSLVSGHHYMVRYCHERILNEASDAEGGNLGTGGESGVGILDLCHELRIPRRTLQYAFERITGMAPNQYLRAVRLNAADRGLRQCADVPVTDMAMRWGFSHASHFTKEYKKLFGHTPSRRATATGGRQALAT